MALANFQPDDSSHERQIFLILHEWLSGRDLYSKRLLLEDHLEMLTLPCEQYLQQLIALHSTDKATREALSSHLWLLQDARTRGGTIQAVREAYINIASISVLDLPPWLEQTLYDFYALSTPAQARQTLPRRAMLIADALRQVKEDDAFIQEVQAELQTLLGELLQETQPAEEKAIEDAIALYKEAAQVYTRTRYPLRYASLMNNLALAYVDMRIHLPVSERGFTLECAITYMEEAASLYSPQRFPVAWTHIQSNLVKLYHMCLDNNQKETFAHYQDALYLFTLDHL